MIVPSQSGLGRDDDSTHDCESRPYKYRVLFFQLNADFQDS